MTPPAPAPRRFDGPVADYMTREVERVDERTTLPAIARVLERCNISSVPVIDGHGRPVGLVSRTDLLRAGAAVRRGPRRAALHVPDVAATEAMTRGVRVVHPQTTLADAAARMWGERVHRLYVVEDERLVGVLSVADVAAAVRDAGFDEPIDLMMTSPVCTIETTEVLETAVRELARAAVSGLIVVEDGWPVGVFTQVEALAARDLPLDAQVEDVFDQAVICLPAQTRIGRAAAQVARLDVRRVVVCRRREAIGVVSGLDFARLVAQGRPSPNG